MPCYEVATAAHQTLTVTAAVADVLAEGIILAANSSLDCYVMEAVPAMKIRQEAGSTLRIFAANVDLDVHVQLLAAQAACYCYLLDANLQAATRQLQVFIEHCSADSRSVVQVRGVASAALATSFTGKILVHPAASGTQAHLEHKYLLLTPEASVNVRPELEIYHDEVECSHGAAIASIDAAMLLYLQSRGLSLLAAQRLLTRAFVAPVLEGIALAEVKEYVESLFCS
jgi:Fe-S cluster assembly scaffold protein SufB